MDSAKTGITISNVPAKMGGQRKKMKPSVLRTLTNATPTILVVMEPAQIQTEVLIVLAMTVGRRMKVKIALRTLMNASQTIFVVMEPAQIQMVVLIVLAMMVGKKK